MALPRDAFGSPARPLPEETAGPSRPPARLPSPPFCTAVIAVCAAVFLGQNLVPGLVRVNDWVLYGPAVEAGQWWRVLSALLVHGDILHIVCNMLAVVNLGFAVERLLGTPRMAAVSLVSALGSAAMVLAFSFENPTLGASGMILGWAGVLLPVVNTQTRKNLFWLLVPVAIISFLPHVSSAGHLGGFLAGLACGGLLRFGPKRFNQLWPLLALGLVLAIALLAHPNTFSPR